MKIRWVAVGVHAAVVVVLYALFFSVLAASTPQDANIGLGLVGLPLMLLGVPWTLPALIDPYRFDGMSDALRLACFIGPAALNVALHAAISRWHARRHR